MGGCQPADLRLILGFCRPSGPPSGAGGGGNAAATTQPPHYVRGGATPQKQDPHDSYKVYESYKLSKQRYAHYGSPPPPQSPPDLISRSGRTGLKIVIVWVETALLPQTPPEKAGVEAPHLFQWVSQFEGAAETPLKSIILGPAQLHSSA